MKTLAFLWFIPYLCLTSCVTETVTAPDGTVTVTKRIDLPAFSKGADTLTTIVVDSRSGK